MNKQLRRYDGSNGSLFHRARAEYNTPKYPRGYECIFSVDEGATTNYRRVFNPKNRLTDGNNEKLVKTAICRV